MARVLDVVSTTTPITADNLPSGAFYDEDGCCFQAIRCDPKLQGVEWRWQPKNWKAFAKGEPDKDLHSHYPAALSKLKRDS